MKLNGQIDLAGLKKFFSITTVLRLVLMIVVIFELYLAYHSLWGNLHPQAQSVGQDNLVRANRAGFDSVSAFVTAADNFVSQPPVLSNPNPFKYSQ